LYLVGLMKRLFVSILVYGVCSLNNHSVAATQSELELALAKQQQQLALIEKKLASLKADSLKASENKQLNDQSEERQLI